MRDRRYNSSGFTIRLKRRFNHRRRRLRLGDCVWRRDDGRRSISGYRLAVGRADLHSVLAAKQALEEPRAGLAGLVIKCRQGLLLQAAQLAEQCRQFTRLASTLFNALGKLLERFAHFTRRFQGKQLIGQAGDAGDVLLDAILTALFRIQHGFFQPRNKPRQTGINIIATQNVTQFLHALVNRLVTAFSGQRAAHQATS